MTVTVVRTSAALTKKKDDERSTPPKKNKHEGFRWHWTVNHRKHLISLLRAWCWCCAGRVGVSFVFFFLVVRKVCVLVFLQWHSVFVVVRCCFLFLSGLCVVWYLCRGVGMVCF